MIMEYFIQILKQIVLVIGVAAPAIKIIFSWASFPKNLEERYSRIARFFQCDGLNLPPLLMEAALGAALGHLKLSATEIPLVLKQREPTRFLDRYLQVQQYLAPNVSGTAFILRSIAASLFWRNFVRICLTIFFVPFALGSSWLAFFSIPMLMTKESWFQAVGAGALCIVFAVAAWVFFVESRRITWAVQLQASQRATQPLT
jgi:hypothetical protein